MEPLQTFGVTILALFKNKPDLLEWVTLMVLLGVLDGTKDPFGKCSKCPKSSAVMAEDEFLEMMWSDCSS